MNPEIIENFVGAVNELCFNFQYDCLFEICKLGEEISQKLLELFCSRQSTLPIKVQLCLELKSNFKITSFYFKDSIMKFFALQIELHHLIEKANCTQNSSWMVVLFLN